MPTLHVHLDEAGELDFTRKARSRYYVLAAVWTYNPLPLATALTALRFTMNKAGSDVAGFHAQPDPQSRRQIVLNTIDRIPDWKFVSVVVEKRKVHPSIRAPQHFYPKFAGMPLHLILKYRVRPGTSQAMIYTGPMPVAGRPRHAIQGAIKIACRKNLPGDIPFNIFHHPNHSNCWLQVADYCCWVVQRKWEMADLGPYTLLKGHLAAPELEVLRHGAMDYY